MPHRLIDSKRHGIILAPGFLSRLSWKLTKAWLEKVKSFDTLKTLW